MDGLKGFPEAIESAYLEATVQTCIVHLIRHSLAYASWKERKALAPALKAVYKAPTKAAAASALDAFEAGPWRCGARPGTAWCRDVLAQARLLSPTSGYGRASRRVLVDKAMG